MLLSYNKTIQLLLYGATIAVDCEVHNILINVICNHYEELFNIKPALRREVITNAVVRKLF